MHPHPSEGGHPRVLIPAAAGSNKGLWEAIWNMYGRCTGMTVSDYFNFIVGQYNLQNANVRLRKR